MMKNIVSELPEPELCRDGEHVPVIVHRTGGPSAEDKNACGVCGRRIYRPNGIWIIDVETEAEFAAMDGLNIRAYSGHWKKARELAAANQRSDDNRLLPYWERVRLLFLELGGEYLDQERRS